MQTGTVLVVDDEEAVCAALKHVLVQHGHTVVTAASGEEALELLRTVPAQVIISDQHMAGGGLQGVELLKVVRVRHPRVVRILLTGDQDPEVPVRSINESEVYRFIRKPWNNADLRTIVSFAFEVAALEQEKQELVTRMRIERAPKEDPAGVEAELLRLAEGEIDDG
jgi:two-component system, probable response regulator PhcQ